MSIYDSWLEEIVCPGRSLTRSELDAYHLRLFNALLEHVTEQSLFYQSYPKHLDTLEEVQQLPTICAEDIVRAGNQMICVSQSEIDRVLTVESSGTTGKAKRLFFTGEDIESTIAFFAQGYQELLDPGDVVLILMPCSREYSVGRLVGKGLERMGAKPIYCGPDVTFDQMCEWIQKEHVNSVTSLPTTAMSLARYSVFRGYHFQMKSLLISGDYLSEFARHEMERIWCGAVFNHYGLTESGLGFALECQYHNGMHLRGKDMYVEILDEQGHQVPDGVWGEMTLTTLTRRGMPLIRYRTGDRARFLEGECPCGSVLKRLDRIAGRMIYEKEDLSIHTLDEVIFPLSGDIIDYTAQRTDDGLHLDLLSGASETVLRSEICKHFPNATVTVHSPIGKKPCCLAKRSFRPPSF